jgi:SAM-dependent methyltransferase
VYRPEIAETFDESAIRGNFSEDNVAVKILRHEITKEYTAVASDPGRGYHFKTGLGATEAAEYDAALLEPMPESVLRSFAGTGNPFSLGDMQAGEHVVDVGSGAGLDALIAAGMVGPDGHVIGVDMTSAMIERARAGAAEAGIDQVEFREGHSEALPVADSWADVVISNGAVNLSPDKRIVFGEMYRVLKPGGRLQIADITVEREVPEGAKRDIDLWTN